MDAVLAGGFLHLNEKRRNYVSGITTETVQEWEALVQKAKGNGFASYEITTTNGVVCKQSVKLTNADNSNAGPVSLLDSTQIYQVLGRHVPKALFPPFQFFVDDYTNQLLLQNRMSSIGNPIKLSQDGIEVFNAYTQKFDLAGMETPALYQVIFDITLKPSATANRIVVHAGPILIYDTTANSMVNTTRPCKPPKDPKKAQDRIYYQRMSVGKTPRILFDQVPGLCLVLRKFKQNYLIKQSNINALEAYGAVSVGIFDTNFYDKNPCGGSSSSNSSSSNASTVSSGPAPHFHLMIAKYSRVVMQLYCTRELAQQICKIEARTLFETTDKNVQGKKNPHFGELYIFANAASNNVVAGPVAAPVRLPAVASSTANKIGVNADNSAYTHQTQDPNGQDAPAGYGPVRSTCGNSGDARFAPYSVQTRVQEQKSNSVDNFATSVPAQQAVPKERDTTFGNGDNCNVSMVSDAIDCNASVAPSEFGARGINNGFNFMDALSVGPASASSVISNLALSGEFGPGFGCPSCPFAMDNASVCNTVGGLESLSNFGALDTFSASLQDCNSSEVMSTIEQLANNDSSSR